MADTFNVTLYQYVVAVFFKIMRARPCEISTLQWHFSRCFFFKWCY